MNDDIVKKLQNAGTIPVTGQDPNQPDSSAKAIFNPAGSGQPKIPGSSLPDPALAGAGVIPGATDLNPASALEKKKKGLAASMLDVPAPGKAMRASDYLGSGGA